MKISKKRLMEIIMEELGALGSTSVSRSDRSKHLRQQAKSASSETGVDSKERSIIQQIETNLTKLANLGNIKTGSVFTVLQKVNKLMEAEIEKLDQGTNDEK